MVPDLEVVRVERVGDYFDEIIGLLGMSADEHSRRSVHYKSAIGMRQSDADSLTRYVNDPEKCIVLVALDGSKVVGCLKGRIRKAGRHMKFEDYAHLSSVCVLPKEREKHIARALVNRFRLWARSKGMHHCMLFVQHNNKAAISAWLKMGFKTNLRRMHCKL